MKKNYLFLLTAALAVSGTYALTETPAEDGAIHVTTADGLKAAVDTAASGSTIIVDVNQTVNARMQISGKKLTIKGANKDIALSFTNGNQNFVQIVGKDDAAAEISFSDLLFDATSLKEKTYRRQGIEVKESGKATFTNVTFKDMRCDNGNGVINVKDAATANFINCSTVDCLNITSSKDTIGVIAVDNENVTVSGTSNMTFKLKKALNASEYTGNSEIWLNGIKSGSVVVKGATEGFTLMGAPETAKLEAVDGNLVYNDGMIHVTEPAGLPQAVKDAESGATIVVDVNQNIGERIQIAGKKITIKGANKNIAVAYNNNNQTLFQIAGSDDQAADVTIEDLTITGDSITAGKAYRKQAVEVKDAANAVFSNVLFKGMKCDNRNGVISIKGKASASFANCVAENCYNATANDTVGIIAVETENVTVSGASSMSFLLKKALNASEYTGNSEIWLNGIKSGSVVVKGATEGFTLMGAPETAKLEAVDGNLVYNDGMIHVTEPAGLPQAVKDAESGATIVVDVNQNIGERIQIAGKKITIKGANKNIAVAYNNNNQTLFQIAGSDDQAADVTIEDLTITGDSITAGKAYRKQAVEVKDAANAVFSNVLFKGMKCDNRNGVISIKGKASASFANCVAENCYNATANDTVGIIAVETENVTVSGASSMSFLLKKALNASEYNGNSEIWLNGASFENESIVVAGATEGFTLMGQDGIAELVASEGNLILKITKTGIENIIGETDALVNVYTLQGILIKKDVKANEAIRELPAGLYIIGGKKVLVK